MQYQLNTAPIAQFTQLLRAAELAQHKELKIPIQQARLLNLMHTEMLEKLNQSNEELLHSIKETLENQVVTITMDGGGFGKG